jgi:hypothetical protein
MDAVLSDMEIILQRKEKFLSAVKNDIACKNVDVQDVLKSWEVLSLFVV